MCFDRQLGVQILPFGYSPTFLWLLARPVFAFAASSLRGLDVSQPRRRLLGQLSRSDPNCLSPAALA